VKYGQHVPERISERVAKKLEQAVLARETMVDGSLRAIDRRQLLWFDVVARYLPPLFNGTGQDTWQSRPAYQRLENERTYSHDQLDRMQRVLILYFPSYLDHKRITWERNGRRKHNRVRKVYIIVHDGLTMLLEKMWQAFKSIYQATLVYHPQVFAATWLHLRLS
jgi:hypothetical protein